METPCAGRHKQVNPVLVVLFRCFRMGNVLNQQIALFFTGSCIFPQIKPKHFFSPKLWDTVQVALLYFWKRHWLCKLYSMSDMLNYFHNVILHNMVQWRHAHYSFAWLILNIVMHLYFILIILLNSIGCVFRFCLCMHMCRY